MEGGAAAAGKHAVSHAMLSVYYRTVGRQFEVRGAPAVFLPPQVQPLPLTEALEVLKTYAPYRLREALWRVVRSVPAIQNPRTRSRTFGGAQDYPRALDAYLDRPSRDWLVELRCGYRKSANLFSAALISCRDGETAGVFTDLLEILERTPGRGFTLAASKILGDEYLPNLRTLGRVPQSAYMFRLSGQIARIETEIGCSIQEFVEGIADAAAFDEVMEAHADVIPARQRTANVAVYPICTVVRQNTQNLVTSATSTAIVGAPFEELRRAMEPANWKNAHSIVSDAYFVDDPFTLNKVQTVEFGSGEPGLVREEAQISWSGRPAETAQFRNVLNVVSSIRSASATDPSDTLNGPSAQVRYNLCRSIDSTVLWDRRDGGLLVDQGFIKVRPIGGTSSDQAGDQLDESTQKWQVTMRKEVQFSDRTPYVNSAGWADFGQLANYLAPSTLTWWLECDTYRIGADTI